MAKFVYPPEPWSMNELKLLGVRSNTTHVKAVPVLVLEVWEGKERKEGEPFLVKNDYLAERLESSGLHPPWAGKDKSNIVAPLSTIQRTRNLTPALIENVGRGYSQFALPYYEPLLQKYRQYYCAKYPEDYRKLYPDGGPVRVADEVITVNMKAGEIPAVEQKTDETWSRPLTILQVLQEYDKAWQDRLDAAEHQISELAEELNQSRAELLEITEKALAPETPRNFRQRIPREVRIEVWRRDGGQCAKCESRENLEYDHIVPVSKGGSNTTRNIELLCERCNRTKRNNVE